MCKFLSNLVRFLDNHSRYAQNDSFTLGPTSFLTPERNGSQSPDKRVNSNPSPAPIMVKKIEKNWHKNVLLVVQKHKAPANETAVTEKLSHQ